jgi:Flp pilus assembly protein TadD
MKTLSLTLLTGGLAAGLLLACGCNTFKDATGQSKPILVGLTVDGDVAEVPVPTTGSLEYKAAVTPLAYKQLPEAIRALQALVQAKPKDWRALFALAVAQEANGDFAVAKANYMAADALNGGGADPDCVAGVKRIEMRGK